jgi:phage internal scaffolding protein
MMRKRVQVKFEEPTLTKQYFKDDCDVNQILKKWLKTGQPPEAKTSGRFGDFSCVDDYQVACNRILEAQASFDALPSKLRTRFHNDPSELLSFIADPSNVDEAINLGLMERKAPVSDVENVSSATE